MTEEQRDAEPGERLAEMMAWHGMARYADPADLERYTRSARPVLARDPDGPGDDVRA